MKKLFNNRLGTYNAIIDIMESLRKKQEWFQKLPEVEQFKIALMVYNAERGRLWRQKMFTDILFHLIPLIMAILVYLLASQK